MAESSERGGARLLSGETLTVPPRWRRRLLVAAAASPYGLAMHLLTGIDLLETTALCMTPAAVIVLWLAVKYRALTGGFPKR